MALEALANAIAQAGRDYFNVKREDDQHARDRAEKLADEQRAMDNQKKWFDYTSEKGLEAELKKFRAMTAEQRREEALSYGINPDGMSPSQLFDAMVEAKRKVAAGNVASEEKAKLAARGETFNDAQALDDREKADERSALWAQHQAAQEELDKIRTAAGITMPTMLEDKARQRLVEVQKSMSDDQWKQFLAERGYKSQADLQGFKTLPDSEKAKLLGLITQDDINAAKIAERAQVMQDARANGYDISGIQQRLQALDLQAMKLGVNPYGSWESQPFVNRTHAAAPAGATFFRAPASQAAIPTPAPAAPQVSPAELQVAQAEAATQAVPSFLSTYKSPQAPTAVPVRPGHENDFGGPDFKGWATGVSNWFSSVNDKNRRIQEVLQRYKAARDAAAKAAPATSSPYFTPSAPAAVYTPPAAPYQTNWMQNIPTSPVPY